MKIGPSLRNSLYTALIAALVVLSLSIRLIAVGGFIGVMGSLACVFACGVIVVQLIVLYRSD